MNRNSYRQLQILANRAERGARVNRVYARRIMTPRSNAILAQIHAEIAPQLEARQFLDAVGTEKNETENPSVRSGWTWGKVQTKSGKGKLPHFYSIGTIASDLAIENSIGARLTAAN